MTVSIRKSAVRRRTSVLTPIYLGVDGGGTKTHAVITNSKLKVLAEGFAAASNPLRVGIETAVENVIRAVDQACDEIERSRYEITAAHIGLAGVRRQDLRQRMRDRFAALLENRQITVETDAQIALYGAVNGGTGLVIIAGTGSICCGRTANGEYACAGGWGPLAGDEGGGAGIARRALQMIARASDGRSAETLLSAAACRYFRAVSTEDLAMAIYSPQMTNDKIAGFAREVIETARDGDQVALKVTAEAGRELGIAANAVIEKLKIADEEFPVALVGGVFKGKELITDSLLEEIRKIAPKAYLSAPQLPPAVAAAKMAIVAGETNSQKNQT